MPYSKEVLRDQKVSEVTLPILSRQEKVNLATSKRVQSQKRVGRQGYGWVALDVKAPTEVVFNTLINFSRYTIC